MGNKEGVDEIVLEGLLCIQFDKFQIGNERIHSLTAPLIEAGMNGALEGSVATDLDMIPRDGRDDPDIHQVPYADPASKVTGQLLDEDGWKMTITGIATVSAQELTLK